MPHKRLAAFQIAKMKKQIESQSVEETIALGQRIGEQLQGGEVIALIGELGTGKTHLIKGLAMGLAVEDTEAVTSPTFTLINEYEGRLLLYHIDAYRLEDAEQLESLGFDEIVRGEIVTVVEWADRVWRVVGAYEPITIRMSHQGETQRRIECENLPFYVKL
jgi:tRNA threonylcarbamoyladenosine biosynthesis protein TsaE